MQSARGPTSARTHAAPDDAETTSAAPAPPSRAHTTTRPYFVLRRGATPYAGPGREETVERVPAEIRIGWFGPSDPSDALAGGMWRAATMAIEEANGAGGWHGVPFRLEPVWSDNPWGSGVRDVARLVYDEHVWAIAGGPDGPSAHLVEQIVAKARLPYVSPVSTDKTANLANVPWIFSAAPSDDRSAPLLADALRTAARGGPIALIAAIDHDSRMTAGELLTALRTREAAPSCRVDVHEDDHDVAAQVEIIRAAAPAAIAVVAGPATAARVVVALREAGIACPIVGGPSMGRHLFAETAGSAAEGVVFPLLWHPERDGPAARAFAERYAACWHAEPDYTAAYTHDAITLLVEAIRDAGLNRARIGDAIRARSGWTGATGAIRWDLTGQNERTVGLGAIRDGHVVPLAPRRQTSSAPANSAAAPPATSP